MCKYAMNPVQNICSNSTASALCIDLYDGNRNVKRITPNNNGLCTSRYFIGLCFDHMILIRPLKFPREKKPFNTNAITSNYIAG